MDVDVGKWDEKKRKRIRDNGWKNDWMDWWIWARKKK